MRLRIYLQHMRRRDPTTKNLSFYDKIPHDGACFRHIIYHFVTKIFGVVIICWEAELFMTTCIYVSQSLVTKCLASGAAWRLSFVTLRSIFVWLYGGVTFSYFKNWLAPTVDRDINGKKMHALGSNLRPLEQKWSAQTTRTSTRWCHIKVFYFFLLIEQQ